MFRDYRLVPVCEAHVYSVKVTKHGRPEMGPNLYVTPPGSFTHFHQDGHGTVDSGHMCLSGYNEVVILRRLPLARKKHAIQLLTHGSSSLFDPLNDLPHNDKLVSKGIVSTCRPDKMHSHARHVHRAIDHRGPRRVQSRNVTT